MIYRTVSLCDKKVGLMSAICKSFSYQLPHIIRWFIYIMYSRFKKETLPQYDKQSFKGKQHTQPSNVFYVDNKHT